jgi:hypothetical protein
MRVAGAYAAAVPSAVVDLGWVNATVCLKNPLLSLQPGPVASRLRLSGSISLAAPKGNLALAVLGHKGSRWQLEHLVEETRVAARQHSNRVSEHFPRGT